MSKLILRNIAKSFGDFQAVDGFSLEMKSGEFVSLLGPSGCGKTTTLRMIAGFMPPSAGTIEMDGQVISSAGAVVPPEKRRMSMIFQSYAIWPNMTVGQNVGFGLEVRKLPRADIERRVDRILEVVQMGALKGRYPAELSGGQQQRVALARAIVVEPEVLLLDEPLSNLDANLREEMRFEIRRLHDEFNMTMVYVTHDQAEAMVTSDRIAVMNQGHLEQIDAPYEMYHRPKTKFVAGFIGRTNFLKGTRRHDAIDFGGFVVPWKTGDAGGGAASEVLASIRPQNIRLSRDEPAPAEGRCCVEASVQRRAYLGESWDYHVAFPAPAEPLRVAAGPGDVFEVGEKVFAQIDTSRITLVS
jgi:iron(III) transport system ATP-binding protein